MGRCDHTGLLGTRAHTMQREASNRAPLQLLQPRRAVLITLLAGPIELLLIWGLLCGQLRQAPPSPCGLGTGSPGSHVQPAPIKASSAGLLLC